MRLRGGGGAHSTRRRLLSHLGVGDAGPSHLGCAVRGHTHIALPQPRAPLRWAPPLHTSTETRPKSARCSVNGAHAFRYGVSLPVRSPLAARPGRELRRCAEILDITGRLPCQIRRVHPLWRKIGKRNTHQPRQQPRASSRLWRRVLALELRGHSETKLLLLLLSNFVKSSSDRSSSSLPFAIYSSPRTPCSLSSLPRQGAPHAAAADRAGGGDSAGGGAAACGWSRAMAATSSRTSSTTSHRPPTRTSRGRWRS